MGRILSWQQIRHPFSQEDILHAKGDVLALTKSLYATGQSKASCLVGSITDLSTFTKFSDIDGLLLTTKTFDRRKFSESAKFIAQKYGIPIHMTTLDWDAAQQGTHTIDSINHRLYSRHRERSIVGEDPLAVLVPSETNVQTIAERYLQAKEREFEKGREDTAFILQKALGFPTQAAWRLLPALTQEQVLTDARYFDKEQVVSLLEETLRAGKETELLACISSLQGKEKAYKQLVQDVEQRRIVTADGYYRGVDNLALHAHTDAIQFLTHPYWMEQGISKPYLLFQEGYRSLYENISHSYHKER